MNTDPARQTTAPQSTDPADSESGPNFTQSELTEDNLLEIGAPETQAETTLL